MNEWILHMNKWILYICTCVYTVHIYIYINIYRCFLLLKERESKCGKNINLQMIRYIHMSLSYFLIFLKVRTFWIKSHLLVFCIAANAWLWAILIKYPVSTIWLNSKEFSFRMLHLKGTFSYLQTYARRRISSIGSCLNMVIDRKSWPSRKL